MSEKNWPVHLKKAGPNGQIVTAYAHSPKELKAFEDEGSGWTEDYRSISPSEYPRLLYNAKGEQAKCNDEAHELQLADEGFGRTPILPSPPKAAPVAASATRVDELETALAETREMVAQLLAAASANKSKKKDAA